MTVTATRPPKVSQRSGAPIDPRIRQRRIAVRRTAGRRRLRRVIVLVAVLVVVGALVALTRSPLLAVRHLRVEGASRTSADAIVAASGIRIGEPIFKVSAADARKTIGELPWVRSVSVHRSLPSTVVVRVTERAAAARVDVGNGRWAVLDDTGRILAVTGTPPPDLVTLHGVSVPPATPAQPGGQLTVPPGVLELAAAVPAALRSSILSVGASDGGLDVHLLGGGVAELGAASDLRPKLASLQAVLTSRGVRAECVAVLDVTVAAAPALTPRSGCA